MIKVDELKNGKYRYASWPINSKMSEEPDVVINNGRVIYEGNGGNHRYEFVNGNYTYECSITVVGHP